MNKQKFVLKDFSSAHIIDLMGIYLSEWEHRDELLWKQVFTYFYATLIVLFLPNLASFLHIDLPNFHNALFPIIALLLAVVFLYVSIGYAKRLEASGKTYQKLIDLLPPELQRIAISDLKCGRPFAKRMSIILCILMFLGLCILSAIMVFYYLTHTSI